MINKEVIEHNLLNIFELYGIHLTKENYSDQLVVDSLQFISIIIEIEEKFLIRISEDYYDYNKMKSFNDYVYCITSYLNGK